MTASAAELAEAYFTAWQEHDFTRLRSLLADDVSFAGPLATIKGAEGCIAGLEGMSQVLDKIEVKELLSDGSSVITWFDLHTTVAEPAPTANWMRVEDGLITEIRVAFDPRAILAARG
ncbi:nuclear transport factor 2 family protein [Nocardioides sp. CCNWLW239]|uniref:nuclear transport factor 2 family protein n=1 Tax=Nocardioides sp. CCNWLW239 TaxID=3128902 RepID=UPI0030187798